MNHRLQPSALRQRLTLYWVVANHRSPAPISLAFHASPGSDPDVRRSIVFQRLSLKTLRWKDHIVATTRDRLVDVAFRLFAEQGFEQTTVEQLAREGGVSRATFFRMFATKEAVIFPDHDTLLAALDARLSAADASSAISALHEAISWCFGTTSPRGQRRGPGSHSPARFPPSVRPS